MKCNNNLQLLGLLYVSREPLGKQQNLPEWNILPHQNNLHLRDIQKNPPIKNHENERK